MGKKNERPENGACLIFACYLSGRMSSSVQDDFLPSSACCVQLMIGVLTN
jgi:hypothetical protein